MPIESRRGARFADVDFSLVDETDVVAEIRRGAERPFSYFVTPNVDHVVNLHGRGASPASGEFRAAYDQAALRLCDSRILQRLAAMKGIRLPLVTGSDLTARLFRQELGPGDRIVIIGGRPQTAARLAELYPGPIIAQHIPPMGVLGDPAAVQAIIDFIVTHRPTVTLFAIGAPQSEIIAMQASRTPGATGIGLCIGASIDFLTGDQSRAPRWLRLCGLEWAYRLAREPGRLWKRYLVHGPQIFLIAFRDGRAA